MRVDGQRMGCSDSGPPETFSEEQLSRALDVLDAIRAHARNTINDEQIHCRCQGPTCRCADALLNLVENQMIKACISERMRFEMTWSKWQYRSRR